MTAITIDHLTHRYGKTTALDNISLTLPRGATVGLIGPDGVGKSTLLGIIAGVRRIQSGQVRVLDGDMTRARDRLALSHRIAYMPQGLGRNLYPTLSVYENIDFHARLFGLERRERRARIQRLLDATGLAPFPDRAAGKLSGGMKQKVSLCCALVHSPDLLILDEPTTGVDPLSRRQFWALVHDLQQETTGMTTLVATAYIEEAEQFRQLLAMDAGKLLINAPTAATMRDYGCATLEETYIKLLPPEKQQGTGGLDPTPFVPDPHAPPAIEAHSLTKTFGDFTAVDHVSFTIEKGEIFGFLGSNGCGKTTTMKMLTGLLQASSGSAELLGAPVDAGSVSTRMRVGYMSQAFSLYEELTVRQNLELHARLYRLGAGSKAAISEALTQYDLATVAEQKPAALPLGIRQRLQLAAACLHCPEVLILDEPTSGVDPAARDMFWRHLLRMSREDKITIFVSTHFMNEAARCDRISFMHQGRVLAVGSPATLTAQSGAPNLEEAFIAYLIADEKRQNPVNTSLGGASPVNTSLDGANPVNTSLDDANPVNTSLGAPKTATLRYWFATTWTFARREGTELLRDRVRTFFALFGPIILMTAITWGVSFDIKNLTYAVLDHDHSAESRAIIEPLAGSRYFNELPPLTDESQLLDRLASREAKLTIDIPPNFGRDLLRERRPEIHYHIDGAESFNAANINAYIPAILAAYTREQARARGITLPPPAASLEPRYAYNQDFKSVNAIAPGVLMLALTLFPAMMAAVGVVREREIGSIANYYTSPASRLQYLVGKQLPYIATAMLSFAILYLMMRYWFGLPMKGSLAALTLATLLMSCTSTAIGLLFSTFTRSQVAAIFLTAIATIMPALNFSGFLVPISALEGGAHIFGKIIPSTWYAVTTTGTFSKGLGVHELHREILLLALYYAVFLTAACLNLKKQEK